MHNDMMERYAFWRTNAAGHDPANPLPARTALAYVRAEQSRRALLERLDWTPTGSYGGSTFPGSFYEATLDTSGEDVPADWRDVPVNYVVTVGVAQDPFGTDWGDIEPTDAEREATESFIVDIRVTDPDGAEIHADSIGGIDVIDLPGYLDRDWPDGVAYALRECLLDGALNAAREHAADVIRERETAAYWRSRDVVTV